MPINILYTSNADIAKSLCETGEAPELTVEAEYGSYVAEGSLYTAAHHQPDGPYSNGTNPSPCNNTDIPHMNEGTILISHMDLDTIGGCLRAFPEWSKLFVTETESFWDFAEYIDNNGPHKVKQYQGYTPELHNQIAAFWQWKTDNIPYLDANDRHLAVTDYVLAAANALEHICANNPEYLEKGISFLQKEAELDSYSFLSHQTIDPKGPDGYTFNILFRESSNFVNHLYNVSLLDMPADVVVAYNPERSSITLSYADSNTESYAMKAFGPAREIMQEIWGPLAGGHDGIAGTPRDVTMQREDAVAIFNLLKCKAEEYEDLCGYQTYGSTEFDDISFQEISF